MPTRRELDSVKRRLFGTHTANKRRRITRTPARTSRVKKSELKYIDLNLDSQTGSGSGASLPALVSSGPGQGERIGSKIKVVAVECKYNCENWVAFQDDAFVTRLIMHKDPSSTPAIHAPAEFHNPDDEILIHEEIADPGKGLTGYWRWSGVYNVEYSGDTTTIRKNNLYAQCQHGAGIAGTVRCRYRMWYVDP